MAYDVEDKVVQMRFDNRDFDPNIDASVKSLEKLEKSLQLVDGTKGLENVEKTAKNFNLNHAVTAVESLKNSFSAMEIVGITAISNIANKVTNLSLDILKNIFVTPISTGWQEYGAQMDSTQVIMANTGDSINKVTESLDSLNEYADLTIYSFGQMTQAIGKFAAASVDLDSSVAAIKGLSNAAALVGANNQNLYSAYYNLSQALQLGALTAIDWRPLQYSMIGTKTMQKVFIETAIALGKFTRESEQAQKAFSDFKGSLSSKWLDKDVIVNGLKVYSLNFKELTKQIDSATGEIYYLNKEGEKIPEWMAKLGDSATRSATEIRNLQQLWDVIKEEAQTGWSSNWKIIIGDLNESKRLWTNIGDRIRSILDAINNKTEEIIKLWRESGGRDTFINFISTSLDNLRIGLSVFYRVLDKIIPLSTDIFIKFTNKLNDTAEAFHLSKEQAQSLANVLIYITKPLQFIIKLYIAIGKILFGVITTVIDAIKIFIKAISSFRNGLLDLLYMIGIDVNNLIDIFNNVKNFVYIVFNSILSFLGQTFKIIGPMLLSIGKVLFSVFNTLTKIISRIFSTNFINVVVNILNTVYVILRLIGILIINLCDTIDKALDNGLGDFIASLVTLLGNILYILTKVALIAVYIVSSVLEKASPLLYSIGNLLVSVINLLARLFSVLFDNDISSIDDVFNSIIYILAIAINKISTFISKITNIIDGISDAINNSNLLDIGRWIVVSLINGVTTAVPKLLNGIKSMCNFVINTIRNTLQIHSQSPLFFGIGLWIPKSIAAGELNGAEETEKASEKLSSSIFDIFINNNKQRMAEQELQSWNRTLETVADTFSKTAIPRIVLAGVALLGLITIIILLIDKIPEIGGPLSAIADLGSAKLMSAFGKMVLDFGKTLLLLTAAFVILKLALKDMSDVDLTRLMTIFIAMNAVILVFAVLANTFRHSKFTDIGKVAVFQAYIRSITVSLILLMGALAVLSLVKIDNSTNLALYGLLTTFLILTAVGSIIARTARNFLTTLGGIIIVDLVIISIIALIRELVTLADRRFDSHAINNILGGITACIITLAVMSKLIIREANHIWRAMIGMFLIHLATLAIIPLIQVMHAVGNKNFDSRNFVVVITAATVSIVALAIMAKMLIKNANEIGNALLGMTLIQLAAWAIIPLIQVMHAVGNKDFDSNDFIYMLGSAVTAVSFLSFFALILTKEKTGFKSMLLAIANVMTSTSAVAKLIDKFKDLTDKDVDSEKLATILFITEAAIAGLAAIASKIVGGTFKDMSSAFAGLSVVVSLILSFVYLLNNLTKARVIAMSSEEVFWTFGFITSIVAGLSWVATHIVNGQYGIAKAITGAIIVSAMVNNLCILMKKFKTLSEINVPYDTVDKLLMLYSWVGVMSLIAIAIGHGSYYVAIGAAAIIALSTALYITSAALKELSFSKMESLVAGLSALQNVLGKKFGYAILMLISLALLVPILSGLAPALAIISVCMLAMSKSMEIASNAITKVVNALTPLVTAVTNLKDKMDNSIVEDKLERISKLLKDDGSSIASGIRAIAGSLAILGLAFAVLGVGLSLVIPFFLVILKLVDQLSIISKFINDLANNSDNIDKLLETLDKHLEAFKELIIGTISLAVFDKGKTIKTIVIGLAKAFMYAAAGLIPFGVGLVKIGQGILWMAVAIYAAKNLIGDDVKKFFDIIITSFDKLVEKFNLFKAIWITFVNTVSAMNVISIFTLWLKDIGHNLQSFGSGLIKTGLGIIIFALAIKMISNAVKELDPVQLLTIISGIFTFIMGLGVMSVLLAPIAPLMKMVASALLKMSVALLVLSGALAVFIYVSKVIDDFGSLYGLLGFVTALTIVLGILTPLLVAAGVGTGTLGVGLLILSASLAALVGVISLIKDKINGFEDFGIMLGIITAMTAALGALAIPAFLAGIGIGTLGAGLIALSIGLLALVGVLAVFDEVVGKSEYLQTIFSGLYDFIKAFFKNVLDGIRHFIYGIGKMLINAVLFLIDFVREGFNIIGFWIPESIKNGIMSAIDGVVEAAEKVATGAEETLRNILDIHSESPKLFGVGWWYDESIADGIRTAASKVWDAAKSVGTGIWNIIDDATDGGATNFIENTKKKFTDIKDDIFGMLDPDNKDGLFGALANAIENLDFSSWAEIADIDFDKMDLSEYASGLSDISSAAGSTKGTIESLTDTLKDQMNIFERFTADEDIMNPKELINNMKSQLRGMQNWANGIDMLAMRGMSGPLLQYLAEMGPEGYKYVEAFLEMTGEEFEQANELYTQSLEMPESVAKQIGNSYERVGVEIIESTKSASGAITGATDDTADHINDKTTETVNKLSSAVINGVKITKDELTKLMLEYDKDQEMIYFKSADALGNITEHIMSTHEFGTWRASNYAAKVIDETHFNMSKLFSASALGNIKVDNATLQQAAEEYSGKEMLYYVDSVKKFYNREQYADFRKSCQDKNVEVLSITADQLKDIELNYEEAVEDTSKTTQNAIASTTDDVAKTVNTVGEVAGTSVTDSFTDTVESWLDTKLPGLGTTWRDKIAEEFKIDPNTITGDTEAAINSYMAHNVGEEIKNAGAGMIMVDKMASSIKKLSEKRAQEIMIYTVDGLKLNANQYLDKCEEVGKIIGGTIYNGTAKELGIASPSKEYAEIARFSVLGFVQGITKNISLAENASENLGDATLESLSDTIGAISSTFTEDMDTTPTIRPVLDLSNVYDGMTKLDTTFSTSQARIAGRAYMTTYDDSVERLEDAYKKAIMDGNVELANMLLNSDNTNVIVNVHLDTNAEGIFDIVKVENEKATRDSGVSPLMIARNGAIRASLA